MTHSAPPVHAPAEKTPYSGVPTIPGRGLVATYLGITAIVLALLMGFGLVMRASQAGFITVPPNRFYQLLTAHGIGMVAIAGLGGAGVMWFFLSRYVTLSRGILLANLVCFLLGVVLVLGGIFVGGFAAAWTFLFPLPAQSSGVWGTGATASYLVGVLLVGVGFLLLYLDTGRAILRQYGSLGNALGWPQAFGKSSADAPPPAVPKLPVDETAQVPAALARELEEPAAPAGSAAQQQFLAWALMEQSLRLGDCQTIRERWPEYVKASQTSHQAIEVWRIRRILDMCPELQELFEEPK